MPLLCEHYSGQRKFAPLEILNTPVTFLWEILIALMASFYKLKYARIVSGETKRREGKKFWPLLVQCMLPRIEYGHAIGLAII